MLAFKNNIYEFSHTLSSHSDSQPRVDPYNFLFQALMTDRDLFIGLERMDQGESNERLNTLFPHAGRFGPVSVLNSLSKRLLEGLVHPQAWYEMNAYHFCHLYDSLYGILEDYSYEPPPGREALFPELCGQSIDFNAFLEEYFFNTAFLIDPDRFNNMSSKEKEDMGFADPCLFGVINKLLPTEQEILLPEIEYPYGGRSPET